MSARVGAAALCREILTTNLSRRKGLASRLSQARQIANNLGARLDPALVGLAQNALPLIPAIPLAIVAIKGPIYFVPGICNFADVIFSKFGDIIAGVNNRKKDLIQKYQAQIDRMAGMINKFIGKFIDNLNTELGFKAYKLQRDQHTISHAFEEWAEGAKNLAELNTPQEIQRLRDLIIRRLTKDKKGDKWVLRKGVDAKLVGSVTKLVEEAVPLEGNKLTGNIEEMIAELQGKVEDHLGEGGDGSPSGAGEGDGFTPAGTGAGGAANA
ncbi:MAG: hypothetical protein HQ596_04910 [Candidatus Saganbacteria bacterium]|nr:hypothetical protein [Candidatus Saganbacteria bacterium]